MLPLLPNLLAVVAGSHLVLLPPNDPICRAVDKGWLRGVVRIVDDATPDLGWRKAATAPMTTVARLTAKPEPGGALGGQGDHLDQVTVSANGHFTLKKPPTSYRLVLVTIEAQLRYDIDNALLTVRPELFPSGLCVEVFLRRKEVQDTER